MAGRISFPKSERQEKERADDLAKQQMTSRCFYCQREKSGTFKACRSWFRLHGKTCKAKKLALAASD